MNEDTYLQRLKSIREKYGCHHRPTHHTINPKYSEIEYPLTQARSKNKIPERSFSTYSPFHQQQKRFDLTKQISRNQPQRRFSSLDKQQTRNIQIPQRIEEFLGKRQASEAHIKRKNNFNSFINDLDKRIELKDKLISQKFRENERILKINNLNYEVSEHNRQLYLKSRQQGKINYNYALRQAFDKSSSLQKNYTRQVENEENQFNSKINWYQKSPIPKSIQQIEKNLKQPSFRLQINSSKDPIALKLDNGWSTKKLENIQQRIQSALKQTNRDF